MKKMLTTCLVCLVFVIPAACGGGADDPVYNDEGVCVMNCLEDAADSDNLPDAIQPDNPLPEAVADNEPVDGFTDSVDTPEVEQYVCPDPEHPPLACKPKEAVEAQCAAQDIGYPLQCWGGFFEGKSCTSNTECQEAPLDKYPPCACWQVCEYAGNWDCPSETLTYIMEDAGNGTCKFWSPPYTGDVFYVDPRTLDLTTFLNWISGNGVCHQYKG